MSHTIHNKLMALAAEFAEQRQSGNNRKFPKSLWKKAVDLAQQSSVDKVCQAIQVPSAYLKKKLSPIGRSDSEINFVELITPSQHRPNGIKINFESSSGHKMIIDGADSAMAAFLLGEFLRGGLSCCK